MSDNRPAAFPGTRIFIAGHRGMVGSALARLLAARGHETIITRRSADLDLRDQAAVRTFFSRERIDCVLLAAARVGGIYANNTYPAEFIYQNLMIQSNVIHEAFRADVEHLLFLGSSCIYPRDCAQPMREEYLLTGPLEATNEPYAVAKIAGITMCEAYNRQYGTDYRAVMPTNLYGPGDNYHLENSHVIPAMIRKYHLAMLASQGRLAEIAADERTFGPIPDGIRRALDPDGGAPYVPLWGTGRARREFLHVDDMARACYHLMSCDRHRYLQALAGAERPPSFVNIGVGKDCTIGDVAEMIGTMVGFTGETRYDAAQPDGTPRKLLDTTRLNALGWQPAYALREGLQHAYDWYVAQTNADRDTER